MPPLRVMSWIGSCGTKLNYGFDVLSAWLAGLDKQTNKTEVKHASSLPWLSIASLPSNLIITEKKFTGELAISIWGASYYLCNL